MLPLKLRSVFLFITMMVLESCAADNAPLPFFSQTWNRDFHLRVTETGDTLTIGAAFSTGTELFVNDRAAGTVVVLNAAGKTTATIPLESIGRDTYSGDDFIMIDSQFVFINTVDKKVEYFSRSTGKHLRSAPLPVQVLGSQTKRSDRIIDRIFLADKEILIGNATLQFTLETGLKKTASPVAIRKAPGTSRYSLLSGKSRLMTTGSFVADSASGKKATLPVSRYTISGKRLTVLNHRLLCVSAGQNGVTIVDCGMRIAD